MTPSKWLPLMRLLAFFLLLSLLAAGCSAVTPEPVVVTVVVTQGAEGDEVVITTTPDLAEPTEATATPNNILMGATPVPAVPEARQLVLDWPAKIRAGDSDLVSLTLEMDESGTLTPTTKYKDHETSGEPVEVPNLYATHHVRADAWLDIAGVQLKPEATISQDLKPGESITFYWSLHPKDVGTYRGIARMALRFEHKEDGSIQRLTLPPQPLEFRVVTLFGLTGRMARILGGIGTLVGAIFSADDIIAWLRKRFKPNQKKELEA